MSYQHKINPFLLNKILNFKLEEVNLEASKRSTEDDINFNSKEKRKNSTVEAVAYKKSKLDQMDKYNLCGNIPKTTSSSTNHQATEESTISTSAKSQNIYKIMDK